MAFWGTEVKPGKPFTHINDSSRGRLHISQATLGLGTAMNKSLVQCNVGNKSPVFLCSLFPEKTESLQLHIEFEEAEEVIFSVIGPRSVHLTGHYVGGGRHFTPNDESESYGEDIADTETERSDRSDEDVYDDSFIDDGEPAPVSDSGVVEDSFSKKKTKKAKGKSRRLRKAYQLSESDDDNCLQGDNIVNGKDNVVPVLDSEDEDWFPISSLCKPKTSPKSNKLEGKGKVDKKASETCKIEDGGNSVKNDEVVIDDDTKRVGEENGAVSKKKRKEQRKKGNSKKGNSTETSILEEDQGLQDEARVNKMDQNLPTRSERQHAANTKEAELPDNTSLPSAEVDPKNVAKSGKKKKRQRKDISSEVDGVDQGNIVKEDSEQNQKQTSNGRAELPHNLSHVSEMGSENSTKSKKKRKGRSKRQATPEADITLHSSVMKEDDDKQDETRADKNNKQSEKHANDMSCDAEQLASESQSKKKRKRNKT